MRIDFFRTLLISLGLTELLELGFAAVVGLRRRKDLILIALVNVITNPAVVLINSLLAREALLPQPLIVVLLETGAVLIEGVYYRHYAECIKRPFLFAFGANVFSYLTGLLISYII